MKVQSNGINRKRLLSYYLVLLFVLLLFFMGIFSIHSKASQKEESFKYYTSIRIQYGDSLWSIADEYMDKEHYTKLSYIAEVKSINHIQEDNMIKEGKILIIPYYSSEYVGE